MKRDIYLLAFSIGVLLFGCKSKLDTEQLTGQWQVPEIKVDIPNVPGQLIEHAKILALATTYEFKADRQYCMTVSKNELESGRKHFGRVTFDSNDFSLSTDSLLLEKNGAWTLIERNDFNAPFFGVMEMKIEKVTEHQLFISEKEGEGTIFYTLDKVELMP